MSYMEKLFKHARDLGWEIDCENPLEISLTINGVEVGSAKGRAADMILKELLDEEPDDE